MKLTQNKAKVLKKPKYEVHDTQQSATKDIENSPAKSPFGDFKLKKVKPVELKPIDEFKLETVELKHHDKETLPQVEEVTLK